ncbi:MAG TPA: DUF438 domain-containing protein [Myxococcales bacterium]|jgi:hypothetical protein
MRLNLNTKINDLIGQHPFLLDFLVSYAPEFEKLRSPIARATIGRIATITMAARLAKKEPQRMLDDVAAAIQRSTGQAPQLGEPEPASPEQAAQRRDALAAIVRELHQGKTPAELKGRFDLLLQDVGPAEIGKLENELIASGVPVTEVRRLCELHVDVFREGLQQQPAVAMPAGHPVHTFMAENRVFERVATALTEELRVVGADPASLARRRDGLLAQLDQLGAGLERHYVRKENLLFPLIEKAGVSGPPQVMWGVQDDIRALRKSTVAAAQAGDGAAVSRDGTAFAEGVTGMVFKEEAILFPLCLDLFSEADWKGIREAEGEVGYAFSVVPGAEWKPGEAAAANEAPEPPRTLSRLPLDTGLLSLEQVNLMLNHLPVDLSFVDEEDKVRYFTQGKERIFPRSPQVIGREVQNCHPPHSVHVVNRILEAFKKGEKDEAEFWIEMRGRFLHIRYFAMRDAQKAYRGCLEVTQDVTKIRALQGQRRLLDWN